VYCNQPETNPRGYEEPACHFLKLRYLGRATVSIRGTVTQNLYSFSDLLPVQRVDRRDARFLLASRLFGIDR
jgi:hypothetical protein